MEDDVDEEFKYVNEDGSIATTDEERKKISASWVFELETDLKCDREGDAICEYGKCWKEDNPDVEMGPIHHPMSPRDVTFWLMTLVRTQAFQNPFIY